MYFAYGEKEIEYLKSKDKRLAEAIEKIGHINREVDTDIFTSVVHQMIGQQISSAALTTVWNRMQTKFGEISAQTVCACETKRLKSMGMSYRKAEYIKDFAEKVKSGTFDINALHHKSDDEVIRDLSALKGIGPWTAEMLLIFCLQRQDVVSYGDFGILKGMRMLYHHRSIDKKLFEKYKRRYSPYGTVASLYLWAIAGGAMEDMKDYAPKKKEKRQDGVHHRL